MNGVFNRREYIEAIFRDLPDAIVTLDSDYRIVEWNPGAAKLFGYEKEEVAGKNLDELVAGEDHFQEADSLTKIVLSGEEVPPRETVRCRKDGAQVEVIVAGSPIKGERDEVIGVVAVYKDISALKKADRLREFSLTMAERVSQAEDLQEFYQLVHNDLKKVIPAESCFIALLDKELNRIVFPYFVDQYDAPPVKRELANGITEYIINSKEAIYAVKETFTDLARSGEIEIFGTPPEALLGAPLKVKGETIGALVVQDYQSRDIYKESDKDIIKFLAEAIALAIERKQTEEALKESEEKYRTLVEKVQDGLFIIQDGLMAFVNEAFASMVGYTVDEIIGMDFRKLVAPEDLEIVAKRYKDRQEGKKVPPAYEFRMLHKDGKTRVFVFMSVGIISYRGKVASMGTVQDITERKRAEEALKDSERQYRTVVENAREFIWQLDTEGNFVFFNEFAEDISGQKSTDWKGKSYEPLIHPDDLEKVNDVFKDTLAGNVNNYDVRIYTMKGELVELRVQTVPIYEEGRITGTISFGHDITEQKHAEEELRESEDKLQTILESANDLVIQLTPTGFVKYLSPNCERLTGYKPEELIGKHMKKTTPPSEAPKTLKTLKRVLKGEVIRDFAINQIHKDGRIVPTEINITPVRKEGKIVAVQGIMRDVSERKQAEEALKASEEKFRSLFEDSRDTIFITSADGIMLDINSAGEELFGYTRSELLGMDVRQLYLDQNDRIQFVQEIIQTGYVRNYEMKFRRKDGEGIECLLTATIKTADDGKTILFQGIISDVTETRKLEEQFRQSQKMEAVGRLAGGVAHDFNNMLSVIIGGSELAMRQLKPYDPSRQKLEEIHKAAERASNLTRQLLAFSRKQTLQPRVLDLNKTISNMDKMLRRIIGEDVELETVINPDLWKVKVDPGQIELVILNLAVNARDAMPKGGQLTIETMNIELDEDYTRIHPGTGSGLYAMLIISDTGSGMTKEVKEHIFDPFFTTKDAEKGTGLGLSTVYGIIKQSGGNIWVYSEAGKGTTFKIYLPKVLGEEEELQLKKVSAEIPKGSETVLVVEDDEHVRKLAVEMLETQGYKLYEARNGIEAFRVCQQMEKSIDLAVIDVIMPGMSGDELAKLLRKELWPDLKVLFMSGHAENVVAHQGILEPGIPYLQKPLNLISFTQKVREVLDI